MRRKPIVISVLVVVALLAGVLVGYAVDGGGDGTQVARNVSVRGRSVGGESESELRASVASLAQDYRYAAVDVATPAGTAETHAEAVGLAVDEPATMTDALAVDTEVPALARPFVWVSSLVRDEPTPLHFSVDRSQLAVGLADIIAANTVAAVEPRIEVEGDRLVAVPGKDGTTLDLDALAAALQAAAETGDTPVSIDVGTVAVPPRYSLGDAQAVAARANSLTEQPITLLVGGKSATVQSDTLRSWMAADPTDNGLVLRIDETKLGDDLTTLAGDLGTPPVQLSFTLVKDEAGNDKVEIIDGQPGTRCCAPDSVQRIITALEGGQREVALDLLPVPPDHDRAWAEQLGIVRPIASFTTPHAAGEPRVQNIHRIADLTRGMIIEPGEVFSLNERVGQRTEEKGFVEAGVIYDGSYTEDVGGGVSQYATTLFNAAFFGGLELDEYQSHSLVISRYPYGREATISWPSPDLKIRNTTPFGIMLWPTYTGSSITVTLWSTPWVTGEQTGQSEQPGERCKTVRTERTRTWLLDGRTEVDTVVARYQNAEGVPC